MHSGRPEAINACALPWANVPIATSLFAEFLGTLVLGIGIQLILDNQTLANNDPIYTAGLIAGLVLFTVIAAMDVSGGMFNPMLATALLGGCKGHSHFQHIAVYWIGGFAGTYATIKMYSMVKRLVYGKPDSGLQKKPSQPQKEKAA